MAFRTFDELSAEIDAAVHLNPNGPLGKTRSADVNAVLRSLATELTTPRVAHRTTTALTFEQDAEYAPILTGTFTVDASTKQVGAVVVAYLGPAATPPLIPANGFQALGEHVVGKPVMYMFKVGANDQIQYTITELPTAADPTAPGVFAPVSWTALIDGTDLGNGTIVRSNGGYGVGGSAVGSMMSGVTTAAVKASLRFTLHAADGEFKCGFNFDRNTLPDDTSLKLAIHVNPGQGVRALGSMYGYPFSDYVPLVEGGIAQLDILQDGSATFSIDGTPFATRTAGTLTTDGLYADSWVYTPNARISEVQVMFGNPTPTGL